MGLRNKAFRKFVTWIATIAQVVFAISIVYVVQRKLHNVEFTARDQTVQEESCLLNKNPDEDNLCILAYVGVFLTFAMMIAASILLVRCLSQVPVVT
jgi:hypothetical protein